MNCIADFRSFKSTSDPSIIPEEPSDTYTLPGCENLQIIRQLSDAKFPVYLVSYLPTGQEFAMKIFPWENDSPTSFFLNEVRFAQFCHSNIIPIVYYDYEQEAGAAGEFSKISYLLMEFAKYGDLFDVLITAKIPLTEVLVRTYFHQVIEGLEALHSSGAAHLDLKLENVLMDHNYILKLVDFDLSYMYGDGKVNTRGTKNFRAPEMLTGTCSNPQAADIYSAGILLFLMKTGGIIPHKEDDSADGGLIQRLTQLNPKKFWEKHCEAAIKKSSFFSEDFKNLFTRMTKANPEERPTIAQIKSSKWYNKEICSKEDIFLYMNGRFSF